MISFLLTLGYKRESAYQQAADFGYQTYRKDVFCFVQFNGVNLKEQQLPRVYLATPFEVAQRLKESRNGLGETTLKEDYIWKAGQARGFHD